MVEAVRNHEDLKKFEVDTFVTSFSLPVILELSQLQIWLSLIEQFPEEISKDRAPDISIKDVIKHIAIEKLQILLDKKFDTEGLSVCFQFSIENENELLKKLDKFSDLMGDRNKLK
jgi:hypothetical protein